MAGKLTSYMVDVSKKPRGQKRRRPSFKTLVEAQTAAAQYRAQRKREKEAEVAIEASRSWTPLEVIQTAGVMRTFPEFEKHSFLDLIYLAPEYLEHSEDAIRRYMF